ncbi:MAG: DUF3352 domain-containing protein [Anaerolineae bacterium]|nr:DUF3352 domain-containing protein [Anaerolineae bacterium]
MKKLMLIAIVLTLALVALVLPAAAQDDLTSLAGYFPADTPVFAAFRTDDMTIQALDDLAAKIGALTPGGSTPESLMEMLDEAAAEVQPDGTFATVFRSWLGDSAAIGLYELREQSFRQPVPPITIAIHISDQDKAEALFDTLPNAERYTMEEGDGYTLYTPDGSMTSDPYFLFRSDVILITGDEALVETGGVLSDTLADNTDFTTAVDALPADDYAAIAYADTPGIIDIAMQEMPSRSGDETAMNLVTSLMSAVKPQAFGITLLDNRSLMLDVAAPIDADAASPLTVGRSSTPVDLSFAQHIPASMPIVILGSDLYSNYQQAMDNLRAIADMASESGDSNARDIQTALFGINFLVRGLTGMEPEAALGWMTGNYALALGFSPSFSDIRDMTATPTSNPFDLGFIVEATDADAAQALFEGLRDGLGTLQTPDFSVSETTLDSGADAISLQFTSEDVDFPIELQVATGNGVFVIGTPRMVRDALNPSNSGLDAEASFVEASQFMLADSTAVLFVSSGNLEPLARAMTASGNPSSMRTNGKQVQQVLDLFNSLSISASVLPDGAGQVSRFVWTLPE